MRIYLLLLCWLGLTLCAWAQSEKGSPQIRELEQELREATRDTTRVRVLLQLVNQFEDHDTEQALRYCQQALAIAERTAKPRLLTRALSGLGWVYMNRSEYPKALQCLQRSLRVAQAAHLEAEEIIARHGLGTIYNYQGNYPMALVHLLPALRYCEENPKRTIGNYVAALSAVGSCYFYKGDYHAAISYFRRAETLLAKSADKDGLDVVYAALGASYMEGGNMAEAERLTKKARQLYAQANNRIDEAVTVMNLGEIYFKQNRLKLARQHYEEAVAIARRSTDEGIPIEAGIGLARVQVREGQYAIADQNLEELLVKSRRYRMMPLVQQIYKVMGELAEARGNFQQALILRKKETALEDSLVGAKSREQVASIQDKYDNYSREKQALRQQQRIKQLQQQRKTGWLWAGLAVAAALGGSMAGTLWLRHHRLRAQRALAKQATSQATLRAEQVQTQAELQQVRHQLDLKQQELASLALSITQKGEFLDEVRKQIDGIAQQTDDAARRQLQQLRRSISQQANTENDWAHFTVAFEQVHQTFFATLRQRYPDITPYELRLAALLRLNLASRDMAAVLGISEDSVKKARYRLRRKLGLESNTNLVDFMMSVDDGSDNRLAAAGEHLEPEEEPGSDEEKT